MDACDFGLKIYKETAFGAGVYYADVSGINIDEAKKYVSAYRLNKTEQLKQTEDIRRSLGAELLLIHALIEKGIDIPLNFRQNEYGKPCFEDNSGWNFNLAHAGKVAVCAIAETEVGVDVEKTDRKSERIADRYFSAEEKNFRFSYIWTRKEALVKAEGTGISLGLDRFSVIDSEVVISGDTYKIASIPIKISGYDLALCVK